MPDALFPAASVALHVPLFFLVLWLSDYPSLRVRERSQLAFASFLVLHVLIHFGFSSHPEYDFQGVLSRVLIFSFAGFATLFLATRWHAHCWEDAARLSDAQ